MIYAILWLESLAVCVLGVLWGFTHWQQNPRLRFLGRSAMVLPVLFAIFVCAIQVTSEAVIFAHNKSAYYLFYSVSFTVVLILSLVILLRRGFRKDGEQRRIATWPLARLGIATLACIALYITTLMTTDTTMQMKLANVRLEAGALAMSEAPPRPVERENAALIYARAFDRIDAWKSESQRKLIYDYTKDFKLSDPAFDTANPALREYLAKMKTALDLLRRAAAMPACAFDRNFATPSIAMPMPELGKLRECVRLLALDARCRAADGDIKGAFENIRAINGISEHLGYEPVLISGLVSMNCYNIGTETLEGILRTTNPSAADIDAAWSNDEFFSFRRVYKRSLRGERAFGLSAFAMLGDTSGLDVLQILVSSDRERNNSSLTFSWLVAPFWRVYLLPSDLHSYNEAMQLMEQSSTYTFKQGKASFGTMESSDYRGKVGILTGILMPAFSRFFVQFHASEARVRLVTLARAVSLYHAKNKAYPKDLDALVPEFLSDIPLDPFDGKPLRMKSESAGVTLYSVGENETDDGGTPPEKNREKTGDIVLRIGKVDKPASTDSKPAPALPGPPKTGF